MSFEHLFFSETSTTALCSRIPRFKATAQCHPPDTNLKPQRSVTYHHNLTTYLKASLHVFFSFGLDSWWRFSNKLAHQNSAPMPHFSQPSSSSQPPIFCYLYSGRNQLRVWMIVTNTHVGGKEDRKAIGHTVRQPSPSLHTIGCKTVPYKQCTASVL
jgi:hypothetical protein